MAHLIERDGTKYCIEEDGAEWEYHAAQQALSPQWGHLSQLEDENAMLALELVNEKIRLDGLERRLAQSESEQAALLLELVDKKGGAIDGLVRNIKTALRRRTV
jgi:hypothetical protein